MRGYKERTRIEKMEQVSIVVPVYNTERQIRRCLDAIQAQTYSALQILMIDDGSQDNSLALCRQYAKTDARFQVLSHENRGVSYTRNCGIDLADGTYLMFLDADDSIAPDMIEQYVLTAERERADVVIGGIHMLEADGREYAMIPHECGNKTLTDFLECVCRETTGIFGYVPNKLYRLSLIRENQIRFCEDMAAQEDLEFALRVYQVCERFSIINHCGYFYYHIQSNRKVPAEDLLGNQIMLFHMAEQAGVPADAVQIIGRKLQSQTYTSLYDCSSTQEIQALAAVDGLVDILKRMDVPFGEWHFVLKWFTRGKQQRILRYFTLRHAIKSRLRKN